MINLILFGPPGSGKGTQGQFLVEKFNLLHVSTGDLFRHAIKNQTPLGVEAKSYIDKGELVPDSVTINMLKEKLDANPDVKGYIFDGYPRTVPQAEALDEMLTERGQEVTLLIELKVEENEIVSRLLKRAETSGRSDDADESIIRNRFQVYLDNTAIVADHYAAMNKSVAVEGIGTIEEIAQKLEAVINDALLS
ncbi:MAG: adenylate kinase [Bacteroidota bacterium]